jgi:thymidylate synthase (FAD)
VEAVAVTPGVIPDGTISVLDHGFVRLDESMASDLSVANAARVSFARRKDELDESDAGLIRFLMRDRHGTPFEHNAFRFHIRTPIFVAREWFRHRIGCLTEDAVVTFVDCEGSASVRKTMGELWQMWSRGERNPHALPAETAAMIDRLHSRGLSMRSIASELGVGRRSVCSQLRGRNAYRDGRWRVRKMRLRVLDESTGAFGVGHISDVVDKGIQPVYRLTLADGKELTLTEEHQLLTPEGWRTMRDATGLSGRGEAAMPTRECFLMTNGVPAHQSYEWLKTRREAGKSVSEIAEEAGCSYYTVRKWLAVHDLRFSHEERYRSRTPWNKGLYGYRTRMVVSDRHREAIRRARSGSRSNFWRGGVSARRASIARWTTEQAARLHLQFDYTCQVCQTRGRKLHAHHVVPVWFDPERALEIGNLVSICDGCHRRIHATRDSELEFMERLAPQIGVAREIADFQRRGWKLTAQPVRVVAIRYVGLRQTYDLCVEGPWHNFVANGVVVHNSFNEFSMRYAKATDEFYVPAPNDVRTQVGKPGSYSFEQVSAEVAETTREELRAVYDAAYAAYERLVELGVARELARCVMPVGAYTEFYWTVNARALMNFLSLRAAETAQREIRYYAEACERFFAEAMPVTYEAFAAAGRVAP